MQIDFKLLNTLGRRDSEAENPITHNDKNYCLTSEVAQEK